MRFQELNYLFEHNVVNVDAIQSYVGGFAHHCKSEIAKEWFTKTLARHLEQDDDFNKPMGKDEYPRNPPAWLAVALERGDDVRVFTAPQELTPIFDHLVDYFNWLTDSEDPIMQDRRRILAVTVPIAIKKSEEWVQGDARKAMKQEVSGVQAVASYPPYVWVTPTTYEAVVRDGKVLQNCLGQGMYEKEFRQKQIHLFFLHDSKGEPHVAIRAEGKTRDILEVKGKQNQPPVGRYIALTAQFINDQKLKVSGGQHDIKLMGLVIDPQTGHVGTASSFGKVVMSLDGGIKVVEVDGQIEVVRSQRSYEGDKQVGGGKNYWFVSATEGDLFTVTHDKNGKIMVGNMPDGAIKYRPMVQQFLNEFFADGAPLPVEDNSYGRKNGIEALNLPYDYLAHKYGLPEEVSKEEFKVGDLVGYLKGINTGHGQIKTILEMRRGGDSDFSVSINKDKVDGVSWDYQYTAGHHFNSDFAADQDKETKQEQASRRPALIAVLNHLKLPPNQELITRAQKYEGRDNWRGNLNLFYSATDRKYGDISVNDKLWSEAGITVYSRKEAEGHTYISYAKGNNIIFEFTEETTRQEPILADEKYRKVMQKILIASLNACAALDWVKTAEVMLDEYDVFLGKNGKWTTRESAGEKFHVFDDGAYFTRIDRGQNTIVYTAYTASDQPIISMDIRDNRNAVSFKDFDHGRISASRYFQWLLNNTSYHGADTVDAGGGYRGDREVTAQMALWHMGLFYDTRSDSWKLVQDGKMVYEGSNFRAINFRNRIFIVDNHSGILGYFKKNGTVIEDERAFPPHSEKDLYGPISEIVKNTDYVLNRGQHGWSRDYEEKSLNDAGYGFHHETKEFGALSDHYPERVVAELPKGEKWIQRSYEKSGENSLVVGDEGNKETRVHPNRYSLVNKDGKTEMRVDCDDDHVKTVVYRDDSGMYNRNGTDLNRMPAPLKKKLIVLLEKNNLRLSPTHAKEFGYYRSAEGTFKPLKGNKALEGYLDGKIVFADGHEFRFTHGEWNLGKEDPNEEHAYNRFTPYIKVKLDDEGIESVSYLKKNVKRNPKEYMPYIHKLMTIFSTIAGGSDDD
jgi:hypothetical protein